MVRLLVRRLVPLVVIIGAVLSIQIIQTAERDIYFLLQPENAISFGFFAKILIYKFRNAIEGEEPRGAC